LRPVIYMNGGESRDFWGGRSAASPFAYACDLQRRSKGKGRRKGKVFLGGGIVLRGLGKYHDPIKKALEKAGKPLKFGPRGYPVHCDDGESVWISNKVLIYQKDDPLLGTGKGGICWAATIKALGARKCFSDAEWERFRLTACKIADEECPERRRWEDESNRTFEILVSDVEQLEDPLGRDNSTEFQVFARRGTGRKRGFWDGTGTPAFRRSGAFVHIRARGWAEFDERKLKTAKWVGVEKRIDGLIKHNRIRESLLHTMLKVLFAKEGWWVNYEIPVKAGRIDFLVKRNRHDDWRVIEVKLRDKRDASAQLRSYMSAIRKEVQKSSRKERWDTHFELLKRGKRQCKHITGVILCEKGEEEECERNRRREVEVWTYKYCQRRFLGVEVRERDGKRKLILHCRERRGTWAF